jgi:hypothetical protein
MLLSKLDLISCEYGIIGPSRRIFDVYGKGRFLCITNKLLQLKALCRTSDLEFSRLGNTFNETKTSICRQNLVISYIFRNKRTVYIDDIWFLNLNVKYFVVIVSQNSLRYCSDISGVQSAGWLDTDFAVGNFCETAASLADKNACARPVLLAHIDYFFR